MNRGAERRELQGDIRDVRASYCQRMEGIKNA